MLVKRAKTSAFFYLRLAFGALLLLFLFRLVEFDRLALTLSTVKPQLLVAAFLAMLLNYGVKTYRWASILRFQRPDLSFGQVARFNFVSVFLGNFLPSNLSSDIVRIYYISRHTAAPGVAISSIFADRIIGNFAVALATVAAFLAPSAERRLPNRLSAFLRHRCIFVVEHCGSPDVATSVNHELDKELSGTVHQPKTVHKTPGYLTTPVSLQEPNGAGVPSAGAGILKRDYHDF